MNFFTIFLLVLIALSATFGTAEAGWLKKQLKNLVSSILLAHIITICSFFFISEYVSQILDICRGYEI